MEVLVITLMSKMLTLPGFKYYTRRPGDPRTATCVGNIYFSVFQFTFVAVTCGMSGVSVADRKSLIHLITSNGWREDGMVWHCTNECASNVYEAANNVRKTPTGKQGTLSLD